MKPVTFIDLRRATALRRAEAIANQENLEDVKIIISHLEFMELKTDPEFALLHSLDASITKDRSFKCNGIKCIIAEELK